MTRPGRRQLLRAAALAPMVWLSACGEPAAAPGDATSTPTAAPAAQALASPSAAPSDARGREPADTLSVRRIAFGSCCDQDRPQPIWDAIHAAAPDLMIFGGDNVYASAQPWRAERLAAAYARLAAEPGFARLRARIPQLATWDDHDYGLNDGGAEFPHKAASKEAFLRFWGAGPDDPRRQRPGVYHARTLGPVGRRVQVLLLDGRWFRSPLRPTDRRGAPGRERYLPDTDPDKTLLGAAQWAWLAERLREPAELRLVVSGVQVLARGHGWECWDNLPLERARLLRLVADSGARGVLFLSGDRHLGAVHQERLPDGRTLLDITSSGLTHAWRDAREETPNRIGDLVRDNHAALFDIDWERRALGLRFIGEDGRLLRQEALGWPLAA